MSSEAHAILFYGIRISTDDIDRKILGENLKTIASGDHSRGEPALSCFLYIAASEQKDSNYESGCLDLEKIKVLDGWDKEIMNFCSKNNVHYESPKWYIAAYYG